MQDDVVGGVPVGGGGEKDSEVFPVGRKGLTSHDRFLTFFGAVIVRTPSDDKLELTPAAS